MANHHEAKQTVYFSKKEKRKVEARAKKCKQSVAAYLRSLAIQDLNGAGIATDD